MEKFKIRCSAISHIMGRMGLTETQTEKYNEILNRTKALTDNMKFEFAELSEKLNNPKLPAGCITYLKEWYAEQQSGEKQEVYSKYFAKGNYCEAEAIDVAINMFGLGFVVKNKILLQDEYKMGTFDCKAGRVVFDTKCSWDYKTFLNTINEPLDFGYKCQTEGYIDLTGAEVGKVAYVLLDTPEDANYGNYVSYSNIPIEKRFFAFHVEPNPTFMREVDERVKLCRFWLENYDKEIQQKLNRSWVI
jgi:hypothetical protein